MSTERGFRLPLAARIFFASGIMVAIAVALAALVTLQYGRKAGEDAVDHSLEAANNAQERFEALSFQKLDIVAKTIINDASFVRYVATATVGSSGLNELGIASAPDAPVVAATEPDESGSTEQPASLPPPEPDADSASVKDLLTQFGDSYDVSFGMVLDADGRVVARTDEREAFADDLSDDPLFGTMVLAQRSGLAPSVGAADGVAGRTGRISGHRRAGGCQRGQAGPRSQRRRSRLLGDG